MRIATSFACALLTAAATLSCSSDDSKSKGESGNNSDGNNSDGNNSDGNNSDGNNSDGGGSGGNGGNDGPTTGGGNASNDTGGTSGDNDTTSGSGGSGGADSDGSNDTDSGSVSTTGGNGSDSAKEVAEKLGRDHFLIGMGNDLAMDHNMDGAYTLGVTMDLHYAYLVGLLGQGGWPDWNAGGTFVNILTDTAAAHGTVPMFTLYSMAAQGENNLGVLTDANYMGPYWDGAKLLFERLAEFGDPSVVHLEPDFWAYAQQAASDPSQQQVLVGSILPECEDQPDTMAGMGHCLVSLARDISPETLVGFHASAWANGDPAEVARYLKDVGADQADMVIVEMLDRDAGCFEAAVDPACQRGGNFYLDATNQTSPNFHEHLTWAKQISDGVGKPLLWWQMPFGVPSDTPGGEAGRYRDNKVKYLFEHVNEFVEAGGVGAAFGVGAGNQTYIDSDDGQFQDFVTGYFDDPYQL